MQDIDQASRPAPSPDLAGPFPLSPDTGAFASPMAKRLSAIHNVPLDGLEGTGPRGRIRKADVLARVEVAPVAQPEQVAPAVAVQPVAPAGDVTVTPMSIASRRLEA